MTTAQNTHTPTRRPNLFDVLATPCPVCHVESGACSSKLVKTDSRCGMLRVHGQRKDLAASLLSERG